MSKKTLTWTCSKIKFIFGSFLRQIKWNNISARRKNIAYGKIDSRMMSGQCQSLFDRGPQDLNPSDFGVWFLLEKSCLKSQTSVWSLKRKCWKEIPAETLGATWDQVIPRLRRLIRAKGCLNHACVKQKVKNYAFIILSLCYFITVVSCVIK